MRLKTKKFFEELKALSLLRYVKGGRTDLRTKYLLRSLLALKNTGLRIRRQFLWHYAIYEQRNIGRNREVKTKNGWQ